jgi:hypothetical protein
MQPVIGGYVLTGGYVTTGGKVVTGAEGKIVVDPNNGALWV